MPLRCRLLRGCWLVCGPRLPRSCVPFVRVVLRGDLEARECERRSWHGEVRTVEVRTLRDGRAVAWDTAHGIVEVIKRIRKHAVPATAINPVTPAVARTQRQRAKLT